MKWGACASVGGGGCCNKCNYAELRRREDPIKELAATGLDRKLNKVMVLIKMSSWKLLYLHLAIILIFMQE